MRTEGLSEARRRCVGQGQSEERKPEGPLVTTVTECCGSREAMRLGVGSALAIPAISAADVRRSCQAAPSPKLLPGWQKPRAKPVGTWRGLGLRGEAAVVESQCRVNRSPGCLERELKKASMAPGNPQLEGMACPALINFILSISWLMKLAPGRR